MQKLPDVNIIQIEDIRNILQFSSNEAENLPKMD